MARPHAGTDGRVRIIGGRWRRRVLRFDPALGIRPTPDRVRETLFNWLQPMIDGARCLDLYAGTGALGLEALSRGAEHLVCVDRDPRALRRIGEHARALGAAEAVDTVCGDALASVRGDRCRYDLVFIDPPYASSPFEPLLPALEPRLAPGALVYLEADIDSPPALPAHWAWYRQARAGRVSYGLARPGDSPQQESSS